MLHFFFAAAMPCLSPLCRPSLPLAVSAREAATGLAASSRERHARNPRAGVAAAVVRDTLPLPRFTILQHLAPSRGALSRKFHAFHFAAICRVFSQLLVFAGLAEVGVRAS